MAVNHKDFSHENSYHMHELIYETNSYFFRAWGDNTVQARTSKPVLVQFR